MITYVNTVLVSNYSTGTLASAINPDSVVDGQFIVINEEGTVITSSNAAAQASTTDKFKVGMFIGSSKTQYDHKGNAKPEIRWSNWINKTDVKSIALLQAPASNASTEDVVAIDFSSLDANLLTKFAEGGKRIIIRLTFKDLPTRFRKWTESYEYITSTMDVSDSTAKTAAKTKIASDIAALINKQWKRARVTASAASGVLTLTAMTYSDDNSVDSINRFEKVRFNANVYYTDPAADGWESLNKHFPTGVSIAKTPGKQYPASGKLVRDRENAAFGYAGILNHGEGTWPIIQPAMRTNIDTNYSAITLEFENQYHTADDLFRRTKQALEIYTTARVKADSSPYAATGLAAVLKTLCAASENNEGQIVDETVETGI